MKQFNHTLIILILTILIQSCSLFHNKTSNSRFSTEGSHEIFGSEKSEQNESGKGVVKGQVFDEYTKKSVSYGRVWEAENKNSMVAIDSLGNFQISLLPKTYNLKFVSIGNKEYTIEELQVEEGITTTIKVYLGSAITYENQK